MRIGAGAIGVIAIPILIVVSISVPITVIPTIGTIRWFSAFSANAMNQSALFVVTALGV